MTKLLPKHQPFAYSVGMHHGIEFSIRNLHVGCHYPIIAARVSCFYRSNLLMLQVRHVSSFRIDPSLDFRFHVVIERVLLSATFNSGHVVQDFNVTNFDSDFSIKNK